MEAGTLTRTLLNQLWRHLLTLNMSDVMHASKPPAPPIGGQLSGRLQPCFQLLLIRQSMAIKDTPLKKGMLAEQREDIGGITKLMCDVRVIRTGYTAIPVFVVSF